MPTWHTSRSMGPAACRSTWALGVLALGGMQSLQPAGAQRNNANPIDPRHHFDKRCPPAVTLDPAHQQRDPASSSSYLTTVMAADATVHDCARLCCGDWSCESFAFIEASQKCIFKDDLDALVPGAAGVTTGRRAKLPAKPPPYPNSTLVTSAKLESKMYIGINGDEFPITWGKDGEQYTGAGDNTQVNETNSPLSFFKVEGGPTEMNCTYPPNHHNQPTPSCTNIHEQGSHVPVKNAAAIKACPAWHDAKAGIPNLKSSGVISVAGVLYWAISCFNYGDDAVFNRQRYGPAWIITSTDGGVTWDLNATSTGMFPGRLAAPRFVQYGQDFGGAPDDWVYVYFPGTSGDSAFFENNDQMLLGRVDKTRILERAAYQFYNGIQLDGTVVWTSDSTIAAPVWSFPLMTSVQQANYHPGLKRYIFANWAWISYDGYGRPDHTGDEKNSRTGHQRTQLSLVEAPAPWGPFSIFFRDDDWAGTDLTGERSVGGYTPVIPPKWIGDKDFWIVYTQCCGNPRPPLNNYNFNAQRVTFSTAAAAGRLGGGDAPGTSAVMGAQQAGGATYFTVCAPFSSEDPGQFYYNNTKAGNSTSPWIPFAKRPSWAGNTYTSRPWFQTGLYYYDIKFSGGGVEVVSNEKAADAHGPAKCSASD